MSNYIFGKSTVHYDDVIMSTIGSQITSLTIVYSTVYSGAGQSKHQSSASLASMWGIHRGPVNSPHKWQVTRKMFPFDDVIMAVFSQCPNLSKTDLVSRAPAGIKVQTRNVHHLRKMCTWDPFHKWIYGNHGIIHFALRLILNIQLGHTFAKQS